MESEYYNEERYKRAKKRIKEIKGFYWHLFWYLVVNIFITFGSTIRHLFDDGSFEINFIGYGSYSIWFFWGIGLAAHWLRVFGKNIIFSKDWEEQKIKEYMDRDDIG
ncbi:MAG: 2TM domain-containing protein [Flavobacteriaceae bacterium]